MKYKRLRCLAFIPDGNRRSERHKSADPFQWHMRGVENYRTICKTAFKLGIQYQVFWAASRKNLQKRTCEVEALFMHLDRVIKEHMDNHEETSFCVRGEWQPFCPDPAIAERIAQAERETAKYRKKRLLILFGYDGLRDYGAAREAARETGLDPDELSDEELLRFSSCHPLPFVDAVIRTGEEEHGNKLRRHDISRMHTSGFMPLHTQDAKFYTLHTLWPDFSVSQLETVVNDFEGCEVRAGA